MSTLFSTLLAWIVQFALFVPFQFLKLAGLLFPTCSSLGLTALPVAAMTAAADWVLFAYPVIKYLPWTFIWNLASAILLYIFFRFVIGIFPRIAQFVLNFWWIIVIFYVLGGVISIFTSSAWMDSEVFSEVFGETPTSSGFSGGGFGGGGGGGW